MTRNKDKRMPAGISDSAPFDTARHSVPPPAPAPDIPHPLAELPPEVLGGSPVRGNRTPNNFAEDVGTKAGDVTVPRVIKRESGAAKKSAAKPRRPAKSRMEFTR